MLRLFKKWQATAQDAADSAKQFHEWYENTSHNQSLAKSFLYWFENVDNETKSYDRYCNIVDAIDNLQEGYEIQKLPKKEFDALFEAKEAAKAFHKWYKTVKTVRNDDELNFKFSLNRFFDLWFLEVYKGDHSDMNQIKIKNIIQNTDGYQNYNIFNEYGDKPNPNTINTMNNENDDPRDYNSDIEDEQLDDENLHPDQDRQSPAA